MPPITGASFSHALTGGSTPWPPFWSPMTFTAIAKAFLEMSGNYILPPTGKKVHLGYFCIMSTSILGNGNAILLLTRKIWL